MLRLSFSAVLADRTQLYGLTHHEFLDRLIQSTPSMRHYDFLVFRLAARTMSSMLSVLVSTAIRMIGFYDNRTKKRVFVRWRRKPQ